MYSFCCLDIPSIHLSNYNRCWRVQMNVSYSNSLQNTHTRLHTQTWCQSKNISLKTVSFSGFSVRWGKEELYGNLTEIVSRVLTKFSKEETPVKITQGAGNGLMYSSGMLIKWGISRKSQIPLEFQEWHLWRIWRKTQKLITHSIFYRWFSVMLLFDV